MRNRLLVSIPLFLAGYLLTLMDFGIVWRYFAWTNQTLATIVLWTVTVWLIREGKAYWIALAPAVFMTAVVVSYILLAKEGFGLPVGWSHTAGITVAFLTLRSEEHTSELQSLMRISYAVFCLKKKKKKKKRQNNKLLN